MTYFQEIVAGTHYDRDGSVATGRAGNCREECSGSGASDDADAVGILDRPGGHGPGLRPPETAPPADAGCGLPFPGGLGREGAVSGRSCAGDDPRGRAEPNRPGCQELRWDLWPAGDRPAEEMESGTSGRWSPPE